MCVTQPSSLGYRTPLSAPSSRLLSLAFVIAVLGAMLLGSSTARAQQQIHIAAAADLQPVMPVLAQLYLQKAGVKVVVSYGSSGALVTQITNGAPFDAFFGADFVFPEQLVAANLTTAKAPVAYARGTLVLWARKDSPLQPLSMDKLSDGRLHSLAIADETHAPYGRAAVSALQKLKLYDGLRPHFAIAENVAQAGQYALSGNAQAAMISLTLAKSEQYRSSGSFILVPEVYPEIRQCAVILKRSGQQQKAQQFLDWVLTSEVQSKLSNLGLQPVR